MGCKFKQQILFTEKDVQVAVLTRISRDFKRFFTSSRERGGFPSAQDEPDIEGQESFLQPAEVIAFPIPLELVRLRRQVEPVNDPRIVALEFEHANPCLVRLHCELLFGWFEIDQAASPRKVRECAPLRRDDGRMITVLSQTNDPGMFVKRKGDLSLQREASTFEDDLGREFVHRIHDCAVWSNVRTYLSPLNRQIWPDSCFFGAWYVYYFPHEAIFVVGFSFRGSPSTRSPSANSLRAYANI